MSRTLRQSANPHAPLPGGAQPGAAGISTPVHLGTFLGLPIEVKTYRELALAIDAGVVQLRNDLKEADASSAASARANQWIAEAEDWKLWARTRPREPIGPLVAGQARTLYQDWVSIRADIARAERDRVEAKAVADLKRSRRAAEEAAEEARKLKLELDDAMREAFRSGKPERIRRIAEKAAIIDDLALRCYDLAKEIGEALVKHKEHGGAIAIAEAKEELSTVARVAEGLEVLSKGLALINIGWVLVGSEKTTDLDRGAEQVKDSVTVFASLMALGSKYVAPHIGIYVNLYLLPATEKIVEQIEHLGGELVKINDEFVAHFGEPLFEAAEPGKMAHQAEIRAFMRAVMLATATKEMPDPTAPVTEFFYEHREVFEAGLGILGEEIPVSGVLSWKHIDQKRFKEWLFTYRDKAWAMLYGSREAPKPRAGGVTETELAALHPIVTNPWSAGESSGSSSVMTNERSGVGVPQMGSEAKLASSASSRRAVIVSYAPGWSKAARLRPPAARRRRLGRPPRGWQ